MTLDDISRVYVVNLDRRPDRWEQIQARWKDTGIDLPLYRYPACDGNVFEPPKSWDAGRGAFGCYLSHVSIMVEMVRLGLSNVLILEDDAVFAPDFKERLQAVLADCPTLYDQLYLGYQLLHQDRIQPSKITEHLGRASNCNRNHAIIYSKRGAIRILHRLLDLKERLPKEHIDHWLGHLHEQLDSAGQHVYDVYISIPAIVYQGAGQSDINGKNNPENRWEYKSYYKTEEKPPYDILSYRASYGQIGRGLSMGYDSLKIDLDLTFSSPGCTISYISLHAPSTATIKTTKPLLVLGCINGSGGSACDVICMVDGAEIGRIRKKRSSTKPVPLDPGEHRLEFRLDGDNNAKAHSVWAFKLAG